MTVWVTRQESICFSNIFLSGDLSDLEPPLPISNREVKQISVDDSSWATDCESRSSPGKQRIRIIADFLLVHKT